MPWQEPNCRPGRSPSLDHRPPSSARPWSAPGEQLGRAGCPGLGGAVVAARRLEPHLVGRVAEAAPRSAELVELPVRVVTQVEAVAGHLGAVLVVRAGVVEEAR